MDRKEAQTYTLVNYSIFSPKPEIAKPLTPKQYGQSLLNRKNEKKMTNPLKEKLEYNAKAVIMSAVLELKPTAVLEHKPTKVNIQVYHPIPKFQRLMLRWCFGLKYHEL